MADSSPLEGRTALITGAGRNIGRAMARRLAEAGADVVVNVRQNKEEGEQTADEVRALGRKATVVTGDVSQVDLPHGQVSGLRIVRRILRNVEDIHFADLGAKDVVRHQLVGRIVNAYETFDNKKAAGYEGME